MSRYEELRDAITANESPSGTQVAYSSAWGDLAGALLEAAGDIQRLWRATEPIVCDVGDGWRMFCPACFAWSHEGRATPEGAEHDLVEHYPDCPREALRPLFGEVE